eukprot:TRINITY_DN14807_c0_g1_i2.p1 TRINITY_DN14807_c0_g1~~TRINITY_DN14807_c0_g1_i2.p1  ORF type:complete len:614 (-),score=112.59 TRINITY_DN14807_c0_g1_i2:63-1904(-)
MRSLVRGLRQLLHSKEEELDFELDEKQRVAASLAYHEKSAKDSLRHLLILCVLYLLHIFVHTPTYPNRVPTLNSAIMLLVTMLTVFSGLRMLRNRNAGGMFNIVIVLPFLLHHVILVMSESYVQKRLFFEVGSVFKYLRPPPHYCDSLASCSAWQFARRDEIMINIEVSGYCAQAMVEPRVDVEQLWVIMLVDVYYILMVLPAKQGLLFFLPGLSLYVVPLLLLGGRLDEGGWPVLAIACAVALLCSCIRFSKDSTSKKLLTSLEYQRRHIIDEKIKRCEAEFETNRLKQVVVGFSGHGTGKPMNSVSSATSNAPTQLSMAASAPAAYQLPYKSTCNGEDCLLETSRVFVEGAADSLQELRELQEGQRVLCQDTLTGSFEFVKVSGIQATDCPDEIVRLVLEDERVIDMTAEHPMPVVDGSSGQGTLEVVEAQKLVPELHALSTWQCSTVKINKVLRIPSTRRSTGEGDAIKDGQVLAINTQHPERYKMLVTGPKCEEKFGSAPTMVAVGFANLNLLNVDTKCSFLDIDLGSDKSKTGLCRSTSDPAVYDLADVQCTYPSLGSREHKKGTCKPCNIHDRYLKGKLKHPCKFGASCEFCHEQHNLKERRERGHD